MSFIRRLLANAIVQMLLEFIVLMAISFPVGTIILALHIPAPLIIDTVLAEVILALLAFGVYLLAGKYLEHRFFAEIGLPRSHAIRDLLLGFILGGTMIGTFIGIFALAGWYHIVSIEPVNTIPVVILEGLAIFLCSAVFEEIRLRGMLFRLTERALGSWIALGLSAVVFGTLHLATPHATIAGAVAIIVSAGLASATLFMLTRSLWPVIGLHWAWNFFEGPIFGVAVSGTRLPSILHATLVGPALWTGGAFGPEGGLVVAIIGAGISAVLLVMAVRRGCITTPGWMQRAPHPIPSEPISTNA